MEVVYYYPLEQSPNHQQPITRLQGLVKIRTIYSSLPLGNYILRNDKKTNSWINRGPDPIRSTRLWHAHKRA